MPNLVDVLLLLIIVSSAVTGWRRGFILGLLDLVRWVSCLLLGFRFYPNMADLLGSLVDWDEVWLLPVSFFIIVLLANVLLHYLEWLLLKKIPLDAHTHKFNQVLGLIPGLLNGAVTVAIVAVLLLAIPLPDAVDESAHQSSIASRFAAYANRAETALAPVFEEAVQRTLNNLTVEPGAEETIELPYKVEHPVPQPELEAQMLELINEERIANGLKPLKADTALRSVARQHSTDMFRRGYFSHYSPEGTDAGDRIRQAGIPFLVSGENLALAPTLSVAHEGLMNSPGHRANILQKRYGRVGIGVMKGRPGQLMITQNFRN
ncbi:CvpA family protein [Pontibacter korlensis]|uniref:Colicin V production protein n=1 Tax=Pontibacter korlensis TaxID=400092 RepID=A0A0E3ZGX8_9BACT|nr:CvpA family protein [Pontibacter korlensis]AKD04194.1 colicin V production protein [Pontibacter korlensis]